MSDYSESRKAKGSLYIDTQWLKTGQHPFSVKRARLAMADKNPDSHEAKIQKVRRRLNLGDSDDDGSQAREEVARKLEEEREKELEEKKARWNFDFKEEKPLPGPWVWTAVSQSNTQPSIAHAAPDTPETSIESDDGDAADQAQ